MAIQVGDKLPHFVSVAQDGSPFNSKDYLGKKPLVIYFYPKDDTRVCTVQACTFRDNYEEFKELGAEVIGISADGVRSHLAFKSKYNLPFILLSDGDNAIRKLFGVPKDYFGLIPGRATYVVDVNGIVQFIFDSTSGAIHIEKALEVLRSGS